MLRQYASYFGWAATALSFIWFLVHTFIGGPETVDPLLASDLAQMPMAVLYMVWHMITVILLLNACLFAWAIAKCDQSVLICAVLLAGALCVSGLAMAIISGAGFAILPQGFLFFLSGGLGLLAWLGRNGD